MTANTPPHQTTKLSVLSLSPFTRLACLLFPLQSPLAHAVMAPSMPLSHRESLLASDPGVQLQSSSPALESAASKDLAPSFSGPHLGVSAEWHRQLHSFQFDPVNRSAFFHALGQRREYYPVMAVTVLLWFMLAFQPVILGWSQVAIVVALVCGLSVPILLVELTRMDRRLFRRLLSSFAWWYLFLSYVLSAGHEPDAFLPRPESLHGRDHLLLHYQSIFPRRNGLHDQHGFSGQSQSSNQAAVAQQFHHLDRGGIRAESCFVST